MQISYLNMIKSQSSRRDSPTEREQISSSALFFLAKILRRETVFLLLLLNL